MKMMLKRLMLASFLFLFSIKQVSAATEPIAYWKFDAGSGTTAVDSSGNGINGTFSNPAPTWTSNVPSAITFSNPYSLNFESNGDAVTVAWPEAYNFAATAPRSFSFWYKPIANGEGQYSRLISWSNDRLEIAGTSGGGSTHKITYFDGDWHDTNITLNLGTWYHVTFTYDGTTAKFYIGSELQDEHSLAGRSLSGTLRIGNRVQQIDEGINGNIDDVRIYDYALNSTQVSNLSSGANNPDGDPSPSPSPSSSSSTRTSNTSSTNHTSAQFTCSTQKPVSAPDLFQIDNSNSSSTLYFTPTNPVSSYVISYGLSPSADEHAAIYTNPPREGVISYTVNELKPNRAYFFKVRGLNGCSSGDWSQTLSHKLPSTTQLTTITPKPSTLLYDTSPNPAPSPTESQSEVMNVEVTQPPNHKPLIIIGSTLLLTLLYLFKKTIRL